MNDLQKRKMQLILKWLIGCLLLLIVFSFYYYYEGAIHTRIVAFKTWVAEKKKGDDPRYNPIVDIASLPVMKDESDAWYVRYHLTVHSGGGISHYIGTNSLEAWNLAYENDVRIFDADMNYTSDSVLVLRHSWKDNLEQTNEAVFDGNMVMEPYLGYLNLTMKQPKILSYDEFLNNNIFHCYTPMTLDMMIDFMMTHNDAYVAVDMKPGIRHFQYIVNKAKSMQAEEVLHRVIVGIANYEEFYVSQKIYPFKEYLFRYPLTQNWYELAEFLVKNRIHVVNIAQKWAGEKGPQILRSKGIHIRVAVVDYLTDMRKYYKMGYDGAITNWLTEKDWNKIQ